MDEQEFMDLLYRDLRKESTDEEIAFLTSDPEIAKSWFKYLGIMYNDTMTQLVKLKEEIEKAHRERREEDVEILKSKRISTMYRQSRIRKRRVFVQEVLSAFRKERLAEEKEAKMRKKEEQQRLLRLHQEEKDANLREREARQEEKKKSLKSKRRQFVVGYEMALDHLIDLMEFIPLEEALDLQRQCIRDIYKLWREDEQQTTNDTDTLFWTYAREQLGDRLRKKI